MLFTRWKKNGNYRVVGNLTTWYRIYTRARLPVIREWERANPCDLFWAAKGKGADTAVYTAALGAELAASRGKITASTLIDLFKCFEVLDHEVIVEQCKLTGFPMDILMIALSMYSAGRYLCIDGAMAGPVFACRSTTAGCTLAMFILRATMQPSMVTYYTVVCIPRQITFQIFVDDLLLMKSGSKHDVPVKLHSQLMSYWAY